MSLSYSFQDWVEIPLVGQCPALHQVHSQKLIEISGTFKWIGVSEDCKTDISASQSLLYISQFANTAAKYHMCSHPTTASMNIVWCFGIVFLYIIIKIFILGEVPPNAQLTYEFMSAGRNI